MKLQSVESNIQVLFSTFRLVPHILWMVRNRNNGWVAADLERWSEQLLKQKPVSLSAKTCSFVRLMTLYPEYRNLVYYRMGWKGKLLAFFCRPMPTLYIYAEEIGPGLFIQHGFSTIIGAKKIGRNCWINQQVTIGFKNSGECPTLGDNVMIGSGAQVIGNVNIGSNSAVGSNAVVVKDVPANCTVVGVPAYLVRRNGVKTKESL